MLGSATGDTVETNFKKLQETLGMNNRQIADHLNVGLRTVERWRKDGCDKLSVILELNKLIK